MLTGWKCPNCGAGVAPTEKVCPCAMMKAHVPAGIEARPCVTCTRQIGLPESAGGCAGGHVQVLGMGA